MVEELERREGDETHGWTKAHGELFVPLTQDVQASATSWRPTRA